MKAGDKHQEDFMKGIRKSLGKRRNYGSENTGKERSWLKARGF